MNGCGKFYEKKNYLINKNIIYIYGYSLELQLLRILNLSPLKFSTEQTQTILIAIAIGEKCSVVVSSGFSTRGSSEFRTRGSSGFPRTLWTNLKIIAIDERGFSKIRSRSCYFLRLRVRWNVPLSFQMTGLFFQEIRAQVNLYLNCHCDCH